MFSFLEFDSDEALKAEIAQTRKEMQEKYNFSQEDYGELEKTVVTSVPFRAGYQWQFAGAFYFCTVVVTTVGYGHSTPATVRGRLFCMIFALIGIPLSLVMFQSVGERVNTLIGFCLLKFRQCLASYGIYILPQIKSKHLLIISLSIGTMTIAIGTFVFHQYEGWTIFNSLYYIVITLSTIGFGDYVPLQTGGRLQKDIGYVFFTLGFILFGLAIFSACINLLVLECMAHNADIVTARSRLRRLLSLRRSTSSFRPQKSSPKTKTATATKAPPPSVTNVTPKAVISSSEGISTGNSETATRLSRHYRNSRHSELLEGISHDLKDIRIQKEVEKRDKQFFTEVYELYMNKKPAYFAVRRLPSVYIEHLVHTSPTDVFL
uniref:Potassium channel domain-containing protein n=1 Tax=Panagrolaimus superbus TaxID=310955 RepID=A0A914YVH4_9BILA